MPVPLLDVNAQNHPLEAEFNAAFSRVFKSGMFIQGAEVTTFEARIAELSGARHCIGVSSGTDAILLALMALGLGPGDEVLVPAFTFFATAGCVSRVGAVPVFVDVCPVTFNMDVADARRKVTSQTRAIMPVHLFGQCADMDEVLALAKEHDLKVIEDAAQAMGAGYRGKGAGTMGDFGTYSFFPSKNLGGLGDAGALVCNDDSLAEQSRILRNHGMQPKYFHRFIGGNFRLDALQAALLGVKVPHYHDYTAKRQANAAFYTERLLSLRGVVQAEVKHCGRTGLQAADLEAASARLVLPVAQEEKTHIWNQFTLRVLHGQRDALRDHLVARKIGCEIYYPLTLDRQDCFQSLPATSLAGCATAHQLADEVLSIPIYPELAREQKEEVVGAIEAFLD